jgi:hypothetical protein
MRHILTILPLAAAAFALSVPAQAVVVPFGGGASGTDPLGHVWQAANAPAPAWGQPGLGNGTIAFNAGALTLGDGRSFATQFDFVLLLGTAGVIDQTPPVGAAGFETTTRFSANTGAGFQLWNATFISPQQVRFTAPSYAARLKPGDLFFVNVVFTQPVNTQTFAFAGLWSNSVVPEPATWALMIAGFGLVGFAARRRRPLTAVSA